MGSIWSNNVSSAPQSVRGHHEVQIFREGPEGLEGAEGWYHWKHCEKNKGHLNFIPVKQFSMRNLPSGFQDHESFQKFQVYADLTVRLRVFYTSFDRPEDGIFSDLVGSDALRTGSGLITGVYPGQDVCPCGECKGTSLRGKHWFVYVRTVSHVVFNTKEAVRTKIDLFCDDEISHMDGSMKSLWGLEVVTTDPGDDFCTVKCIVHDQSLALRMEGLLKTLEPKSRFQPHWLFVNWDKFYVLVISHPHGQPKYVTAGEIMWVTTRDSQVLNSPATMEDYSCEYDAPTCPGSSGAPVLILRLRRRAEKIAMMESNGFVHSGSSERFGVSVNYSTVSSPYTTITSGGREPSKAPYRLQHMVKTEHFDSSQIINKDDSPIYVPY